MTYTMTYAAWKIAFAFISINTLFGTLPALVYIGVPVVDGLIKGVKEVIKKYS